MADGVFIDDLRTVAEATARHARAAYQAVEVLRAACESAGWGDDEARLLQAAAKAFGIPTRHRQVHFVLTNLADELSADISQVRIDGGKMLAAFAEKADIAALKAAEMLPRGANYETAQALALSQAFADESDDAHKCEVERQLVRSNLALAYQARAIEGLAHAIIETPLAPPYSLPAIVEAAEIGKEALVRIRANE